MSTKNEVSAEYARKIKEEHGAKVWKGPPLAVVTGDGRPGSIGETIRKRINAEGGKAYSFQGDVRTIGEKTFNRNGYNSLIMCHGVTYMNWFENADMEKAKEVFDVNLFGTMNIAQAFVKHTLALPYRKRIIIIGSMAYKAVLNGSAAYCASKAGLSHLARCMAWELAPKGFDVFVLHPSNVDGTPMAEETIQGLMQYRGMTREQAEAYWGDGYIRAQSLTPGEIADIALNLLTSRSEYLSGAQLELGGGQR